MDLRRRAPGGSRARRPRGRPAGDPDPGAARRAPAPVLGRARPARRPLTGPFPPHNPALAPDGTQRQRPGRRQRRRLPHRPARSGSCTQRSSAFQFGTCASPGLRPRQVACWPCAPASIGPALRLRGSGVAGHPRDADAAAEAQRGAHRRRRAGRTSSSAPTARCSPDQRRHARHGRASGDAALTQTAKLDLTGLLAGGERPFAVAAGFDGRDWVAATAGTVVTAAARRRSSARAGPRRAASPRTSQPTRRAPSS